MTALLSILVLVAAWALLANLERLPWPPAQFDRQYWQTVLDNGNLYLATHTNVSAQVRSEVTRTISLANRKLSH